MLASDLGINKDAYLRAVQKDTSRIIQAWCIKSLLFRGGLLLLHARHLILLGGPWLWLPPQRWAKAGGDNPRGGSRCWFEGTLASSWSRKRASGHYLRAQRGFLRCQRLLRLFICKITRIFGGMFWAFRMSRIENSQV